MCLLGYLAIRLLPKTRMNKNTFLSGCTRFTSKKILRRLKFDAMHFGLMAVWTMVHGALRKSLQTDEIQRYTCCHVLCAAEDWKCKLKIYRWIQFGVQTMKPIHSDGEKTIKKISYLCVAFHFIIWRCCCCFLLLLFNLRCCDPCSSKWAQTSSNESISMDRIVWMIHTMIG